MKNVRRETSGNFKKKEGTSQRINNDHDTNSRNTNTRGYIETQMNL
jgi:hypothetical protein